MYVYVQYDLDSGVERLLLCNEVYYNRTELGSTVGHFVHLIR